MRMNERQAMNGQQLELAFAADPAGASAATGRVSPDRAAWWFERIHTRLRQALRPIPPARHLQAGLGLPNAGSAGWFLDDARWPTREPAGSQVLERAA
jgi:hypothetical protein